MRQPQTEHRAGWWSWKGWKPLIRSVTCPCRPSSVLSAESCSSTVTLLLIYPSHCPCCLSLLTFVHNLSSSTWSPLVSGCFCSCVGCLLPRTMTNLFTANNLHAVCSNERQAAGRRWMNNLAVVGCVARVEPANPHRKPQWALSRVALLDWGRPARLAQTFRKQLKLIAVLLGRVRNTVRALLTYGISVRRIYLCMCHIYSVKQKLKGKNVLL